MIRDCKRNPSLTCYSAVDENVGNRGIRIIFKHPPVQPFIHSCLPLTSYPWGQAANDKQWLTLIYGENHSLVWWMEEYDMPFQFVMGQAFQFRN